MSFRVATVSHFEKEAKRLKKKFPSLKSEIHNLIEKLEEDPETGTPLGNNFTRSAWPSALKAKENGVAPG